MDISPQALWHLAQAGVSVRTLHHYDEIGLLSPSERTAAGFSPPRFTADRLQRRTKRPRSSG